MCQRAHRQQPGDARIVQAAWPRHPQPQPSVRGGSRLAGLAAADRRLTRALQQRVRRNNPGAAHQLLNLLKLSFDNGQEWQGKALARQWSRTARAGLRRPPAQSDGIMARSRMKNLVASKLGLAFLLLVCPLAAVQLPVLLVRHSLDRIPRVRTRLALPVLNKRHNSIFLTDLQEPGEGCGQRSISTGARVQERQAYCWSGARPRLLGCPVLWPPGMRERSSGDGRRSSN
jgi:hypothetical protein